jgi:hypothetical protein
LLRLAHEHHLSAKFLKALLVRIKITLDGENTNLHFRSLVVG